MVTVREFAKILVTNKAWYLNTATMVCIFSSCKRVLLCCFGIVQLCVPPPQPFTSIRRWSQKYALLHLARIWFPLSTALLVGVAIALQPRWSPPSASLSSSPRRAKSREERKGISARRGPRQRNGEPAPPTGDRPRTQHHRKREMQWPCASVLRLVRRCSCYRGHVPSV
jgi:hypothetical protein